MSFSTDVKKELGTINNLANKKCVKAEMFGYLNTNNVNYIIRTNKKNIDATKFSTESEYSINRFTKLLSNLSIERYNINIVGKKFVIEVPKDQCLKLNEIYKEYSIEELQESEQKAFVRGAFLGGGTINNPKNKYHLDIAIKQETIATKIIHILEMYRINFKMLNNYNKTDEHTKIKEKCVIYTKDGEEISKFLAFIEASKSVLQFEDIRVYRNMRNNVNRIVNCETANLSKTVDTAVKQIEAINKLKKEGRFNKLPENLKEIAELRIQYPEASLAELGKMLKQPIGKSGVNYRLQTIIKMTD